MSARGALTTLRRRLLGVAFLMTIVLFLGLTVATYQKAFTPSVDVVLHTEAAGNQLMADSDVKVRGMIVGRVKSIEPADGGAELKLALDPEKAAQLPSDVSARLLPRTLFGERYVSLEVPENSSGARLAAGDVLWSFGKGLVFAVVIILIHCYYGYTASGGPAGVGIAVGKAVRTSIVAINLVDFFLSLAIWGATTTVRLAG